jgi:hypothetical protein
MPRSRRCCSPSRYPSAATAGISARTGRGTRSWHVDHV